MLNDAIDFSCPVCGADLSEQAQASAYDHSEGISSSCGAYCEHCGVDVWFDLEWTITLWSARPLRQALHSIPSAASGQGEPQPAAQELSPQAAFAVAFAGPNREDSDG